jgi:signal transduction histidine kinase
MVVDKIVIVQSENINLSHENYKDIFWNIFHNSAMGVAFTDECGTILFSNREFNANVLQTPLPIKLTDFIANARVGRVMGQETTAYPIESHGQLIQLFKMKLQAESSNAAFLWFTDAAKNDENDRQVSVAKTLYRSFIDNTFELFFRTSESDALLFVNKLFLESFQFESFKHIKTRSLHELFESAEYFTDFKKRIVREKKIHNETIRFRTSAGKLLVGLVNCQLHYDEEGNYALNWTVLNVSERVQYEESLRHKNEQLAKLNSQMEKLLYSTSHDLRSPLTSILGLLNLMRFETNDKSILEYVTKIEISTLKLDKIMRDIMSFSKTAYQHTKSQRISFQNLVWKVINNYRHDQNFKLTNIEVNVQSELPFYSDGERLEIILDSLIRNCIHFVDANKIRPFVRINVTVDLNRAIIEIIDNGVGIGKPHLSQIFTMFYKASLQSRGAGLGLYIVKEGLEQLKGNIQVESELGFGSIFKIEVPNGQKGKLINRKLQLQRGQKVSSENHG